MAEQIKQFSKNKPEGTEFEILVTKNKDGKLINNYKITQKQ